MDGDTSDISMEAMRPPQIEGEALHSPVTVRDGDSCQVTVKVSGIPIPDITWFHGSREIKNCPEFRVDDKGTSCTLYIAAVTEELTHRGLTVKAVNRVGVQQHPVVIKVYRIHTKWKSLAKNDSFATRSPDAILRHRRRKIRRHAGTSMTSLSQHAPPKKPPRSMSMGERDWSYAHASHSTDSILDDVFSFDRKSAFATSTPCDGPNYEPHENGGPHVVMRGPKTSPTDTSVKHHQSDTMTDSGFSEENIFRFRCSDSDYKLVHVEKAPPLALPEDFDDEAFDSPLCSPRLEEKVLTPKSASQREESDRAVGKKNDQNQDWLVKEGNRFTANSQLWISDKKSQQTKSTSAANLANVTDVPDNNQRHTTANRQTWASEEKMRRKSHSTPLNMSSTLYSKQENNLYEIEQKIKVSGSNGISPVSSKISTVIMRPNNHRNPIRPVSETNLDDFYNGHLPSFAFRKEAQEDKILDKKFSPLETQKPTRPQSALRRSNHANSNSINNTLGKGSDAIRSSSPPILEETNESPPIIPKTAWRESQGITRLGLQGKHDETDQSRPRSSSEPVFVNKIYTKADVHMSMEGPSHCPDITTPPIEDEDYLSSSHVCNHLDKVLSLQDKLENGKGTGSTQQELDWRYPNINTKGPTKEPPNEESTPNETVLPCVKILDDAISMIYAEASSIFGDYSPKSKSPSDKKSLKEDSGFVSRMYEYPRMSYLDAPLPSLSEVSEEGSVASYRDARGSCGGGEQLNLLPEEVFSDDSIETADSLDTLILLNTNNHNNHSTNERPQDECFQLEDFPCDITLDQSMPEKPEKKTLLKEISQEEIHHETESHVPRDRPEKDESEIRYKCEESKEETSEDEPDSGVLTGNIKSVTVSGDKDREAEYSDDDSMDTESLDTVIELPSSSNSECEAEAPTDVQDIAKHLVDESIKAALEIFGSEKIENTEETEETQEVPEAPRPSSTELETDKMIIDINNEQTKLLERGGMEKENIINLNTNTHNGKGKPVESLNENISKEQSLGNSFPSPDQLEAITSWTNDIIMDAFSIIANLDKDTEKLTQIDYRNDAELQEKHPEAETCQVRECENEIEEMINPVITSDVEPLDEITPEIRDEIKHWVLGIIDSAVHQLYQQSLEDQTEAPEGREKSPDHLITQDKTGSQLPVDEKTDSEIQESNVPEYSQGEIDQGMDVSDEMPVSDIDLEAVRVYVESVIDSALERYEEENAFDEALIEAILEEEGLGYLRRPCSLSSISEEDTLSEEGEGEEWEGEGEDHPADTSLDIEFIPSADSELVIGEPDATETLSKGADHLKETDGKCPSIEEDRRLEVPDIQVTHPATEPIEPNEDKTEEGTSDPNRLHDSFTSEDEDEGTTPSFVGDSSMELSWDNDMGPKLTFDISDSLLTLSTSTVDDDSNNSENEGEDTVTTSLNHEHGNIKTSDDFHSVENMNTNLVKKDGSEVTEGASDAAPALTATDSVEDTESVAVEDSECQKEMSTGSSRDVSQLEKLIKEPLENNKGAVLLVLLAIFIMYIISWWRSADV